MLEDYVYIDGDMTLRDINQRCIIRWDGDVNWREWHGRTLKHECFKFDSGKNVYIQTEEQAKEFKQIVIDYYTKRKDTL